MFEPELRLFSEVPRWVTIRNRGQKLAEHSFFVALYADQIATLLDWQGDRGPLMLHALLHDIDEIITGDIPGNWKRKVPDVSNRAMQSAVLYRHLTSLFPNTDWHGAEHSNETEELRAIVRCADALDDCLFAAVEVRHGNPDFRVVERTAWDKMRSSIDALPFDSGKRVDLERHVTRAITNHRHDAPRFI